MAYSIISVMALLLNLILNHETLRHFKFRHGEQSRDQRIANRYSYFLAAANGYFITDIAWGFLYERRSIELVFELLYFDCVLYFLFMFITMLAWMRYIVAYLDRYGRKSKMLLYVAWSMFTAALIGLVFNFFYPVIFSFDVNHDYITERGRHITFVAQLCLCLVTSTYVFLTARKATDRDKARYNAVGWTCLAMEVFIMLQVMDPDLPSHAMGLLLAIVVIHSFVESGERKEKETYDHIVACLADDYTAMYYINLENGEYREFSIDKKYGCKNASTEGRNFFEDVQKNIEKFVHPDDRKFAHKMYRKEVLLKNLENRKSSSCKYRLMIDGQARYFQYTAIWANDDKHVLLYEKDIDDEITAEKMQLENQKKHITFSKLAELLAVNFDAIYYVDAEDSSYISYECRYAYGQLDVRKEGDDFFADSRNDISKIVHKSDRDRVMEFLDRDHITSTLRNKKNCYIEHRLVVDGKNHYVRMSVQKTLDGSHYIIGIENIDDEVKKEKQHLKALNTEKELARRDELTGVKNKTAYNELEKSLQNNIESGMEQRPFALVVCDANNLKKINDTKGHVAGDEYLKQSAMILCEIFDHSPVFRVGGDEFVVFLRGKDYSNREELMNRLHEQIHENLHTGSGPILASGMSEFAPEQDDMVSEVFERADKIMYEDKQELKKEEKQEKDLRE